MTPTMSRAKAQRARENRAHVRVLLWKRQPAFAAALAAALAAAERDLSCPACQCRQREMIAHRLSKASAIGREPGQPSRGTARMPGTGAVSRPWEVSDERSRRLLLLVRRMAGAPVLQGDLPPVLRIPACGPTRDSPTFRPSPGHLTGDGHERGTCPSGMALAPPRLRPAIPAACAQLPIMAAISSTVRTRTMRGKM